MSNNISELNVGDELEILDEKEGEGNYISTGILRAKLGYLLTVRVYNNGQLVKANKLGPYPQDYIVKLLELKEAQDSRHKTQ